MKKLLRRQTATGRRSVFLLCFCAVFFAFALSACEGNGNENGESFYEPAVYEPAEHTAEAALDRAEPEDTHEPEENPGEPEYEYTHEEPDTHELEESPDESEYEYTYEEPDMYEPNEESADPPALAAAPFTRGRWTNNVFTSEHLGIRFTMPAGWISASPEQIADGMDSMGTAIPIPTMPGMPGMTTLPDDILGYLHMFDLLAADLFTGIITAIHHEELPTGQENISPEEYIEISPNFAAMIMGFGVNLAHTGQIRLGAYQWDVFESSLNLFGVSINTKNLVNIRSGTARVITIAGFADISGVMDLFESI